MRLPKGQTTVWERPQCRSASRHLSTSFRPSPLRLTGSPITGRKPSDRSPYLERPPLAITGPEQTPRCNRSDLDTVGCEMPMTVVGASSRLSPLFLGSVKLMRLTRRQKEV